MDTFDIIIIGGGSAGCVLANRLSEDGRLSVLLLEAGGRDWSPLIHMPIGYGHSFFNARVNWKYMSESDPGIADRQSYRPRGKVLGGSSAINAMVWARGLPNDFDDWVSAGADGWDWNTVKRYYKAHNSVI